MAGHVPKFDPRNAGNFTETFSIARTGAKGGSGGLPPGAARPEDTTNNPPPARRKPGSAAPGPARRPVRTNPKPVPVSEGGLYGDSHIPTFGTWNVDGDQNFTGIFQAASQAKKGEAGRPALAVPASGGKAASGGTSSGDLYKPHSKKRSNSSWCCFGA